MDQILVGIDIGTTKVCTLVGEVGEDDDLRIVGVGTVPSRGIRKGVIVNVPEATLAIRSSVEKAERISGYDIERAHVSLAGAHVSSINSRGVVAVQRGDRGISSEDVDRALDAARAIAIPHDREVVHVVPRGFQVDGQEGIRDPVGMVGFRLEVEAHIITGGVSSIHNLIKCVEDAGVGVDELLEFLGIGIAAFLFARPDQFAVDAHFEDAALAGYEGHAAEFVDEGGEQFLRHPGATQEEAALAAIFDFDAGFCHGRASRDAIRMREV